MYKVKRENIYIDFDNQESGMRVLELILKRRTKPKQNIVACVIIV